MDSIGDEDRIPGVDVPQGDVGVLFGLPLGGLLVGSIAGIEALAIGLALVGCTLGVATVYVTPPHLTAWAWLKDVGRYVLTWPQVTHSARSEVETATIDDPVSLFDPFEMEESTQELTGIERAWPGANAIERTDGTMEAFVELSPANMGFAMSDDWAAVQTSAAEFANDDLAFPITLHATTQAFPADRLVAQLDERLGDQDVESNPVFGDLIEEYREDRPTHLSDTRQIRYYLGVEVDRLAVYQRYTGDPTPGERLTEFPVLGALFTPFVTRREALSEAEVRGGMFDKLDDRIETVQTELIDNLPGWSASRLTTVELVVLAASFWNGEDVGTEDPDRLVRTRPVLTRQPREVSP